MDAPLSRRDEYTQRTRAALLEAARELFTTRGYESTSIGNIAEQARVTKGAVYHHFDDKAALFADVFAEECHQALAAVTGEAHPQQTDGLTRLTSGVSQTLDLYAEIAELRTLALQSVEALTDAQRREVQAGASIPVIRSILEEMNSRRPQRLQIADAQVAAEMIADLIFNGLVRFAADPSPEGRIKIESTLLPLLRGLLSNEKAVAATV